MPDQNEGARTLPVKFEDQGDGTVAEIIAVKLVDGVSFLVESATAAASYGRDDFGHVQTITTGATTRTVTRDATGRVRGTS